jgi:hypothetical protein
MPAIIGSLSPITIGSPVVTLKGPPTGLPLGSTGGGSSGGPVLSPGGPVVRPGPGNITVQAVAGTYQDYRTLIDGLRQNYPGAISDADWTSTFAPGTAFDTNMADSVLPFTSAPAQTLPNGDPAPPVAILTNQASSLLLLRIDLQKTTGGVLSALWINANPSSQGGGQGSGQGSGPGGSTGKVTGGGSTSSGPAPAPTGLVGKVPTPWAKLVPVAVPLS